MNPNIVWITVDSLRTDHTTLHGYDRDTTLSMESLKNRGNSTYFTQCFSHGIDTAASTASIMTGTYPSYHQVNINDSVGVIPKNMDTLPELLSQTGYSTACVTRNPRLNLIGADRGFQRFHEVSYSSLLNPQLLPMSIKYGLNIFEESAGFSIDKMDHSLTFIVNEMAKRWIDSLSKSEPYFLYLHYNEPHRPYLPPRSFRDRYLHDLPVSVSEAAEIAKDIHENAYEYIANGLPLSEKQWMVLEAMYDAAIAYTDRKIGQIIEYIESASSNNTIIVITADHGELFGEGGYLAHQFLLNDSLTHVPMIVSGMKNVIDDSDRLCQHGDIVRTLLEITNSKFNKDQFEATVNLQSGHRQYAVSQCNPSFGHIREYNPEFERGVAHSTLTTGLRTEDFKLLNSNKRTELFKLPDEKTDVKQKYPEKFEKIIDYYDFWFENYGESPYSSQDADDYDKDTKQRLEDLGYLVD